jgi:hypothetical protein
VKVFDYDSGTGSSGIGIKPVCKIHKLSRANFSVDFANNHQEFAIAGGDGVVRVYQYTKDQM